MDLCARLLRGNSAGSGCRLVYSPWYLRRHFLCLQEVFLPQKFYNIDLKFRRGFGGSATTFVLMVGNKPHVDTIKIFLVPVVAKKLAIAANTYQKMPDNARYPNLGKLDKTCQTSQIKTCKMLIHIWHQISVTRLMYIGPHLGHHN